VPSAAHHVSCVTAQPEAVTEFLTEVLGLPARDSMRLPGRITQRFLGWPSEAPDADASMLGSGTKGLIEMVAAPAGIAGRVRSGTALITFAVTDLEQRLEDAERRGFEVSEIHPVQVNDHLEVSMAVVVAGDLTFELVRYRATASGTS
jgi:catechol 2,3-dioxygenase-like lactoylglutathione lyase family enzyme